MKNCFIALILGNIVCVNKMLTWFFQVVWIKFVEIT